MIRLTSVPLPEMKLFWFGEISFERIGRILLTKIFDITFRLVFTRLIGLNCEIFSGFSDFGMSATTVLLRSLGIFPVLKTETIILVQSLPIVSQKVWRKIAWMPSLPGAFVPPYAEKGIFNLRGGGNVGAFEGSIMIGWNLVSS